MRNINQAQLYIIYYITYASKFQYFFKNCHYILYIRGENDRKNAARTAPSRNIEGGSQQIGSKDNADKSAAPVVYNALDRLLKLQPRVYGHSVQLVVQPLVDEVG